jgi:hypothetical protein
MTFETPILFIVFNRPEHTRKVFERIKEVKPKFLFVVADGPRADHAEDAEKCEQVRRYIVESVSWPCELKTLFRDENFGCGRGPAEAISWFFSNIEEGIVLEDDCLPDVTFFTFCQELLRRYRNDDRIMHISGTNFQDDRIVLPDSYYFSQYPHIWGWASWRRAWKNYQYRITDSADEIRLTLKRRLKSKEENRLWEDVMIKSFSAGKKDVWDYQWCYLFWKNNGISILPSRTLVKNIGLGIDSTHTSSFSSGYEQNTVAPIHNLIHPAHVKENRLADQYTFRRYFSRKTSFKNRLRNIVYIVVPKGIYARLKLFYQQLKPGHG